ncbi:MAG: hypothetical protein FWF52_09825 [Candidatus Azobacteroides sp.]|nr:hypothetical protein [Candidatus Azobacteroides sp.]
MIRKLFLIFLLFELLSHSAYGQDSLAYKSKWQIRILAGGNIPITKLLQDNEVDYLLQYKDHSYYLQLLSSSYFFHRHWGADFNLRIGGSSKIGYRTDDFIAKIQSRYGDNYFISAETNETKEAFYQAYVGIIYRLETNKFYVYPTLSIGGTAIYTNHWQAHLKEKNSNNEYGLFLSTKKKPSNGISITFAPSVSFGYKLSKRVFLNADVMLSYFRPNFVFEKQFTNLYTKKSAVEHFYYKKNILTLGLGGGIIIVIH